MVEPDDALFRIDQVLKRKGNQVFVSWKGWPKEYSSWIWKKRFTSTMNEFRFTLVSDPTDEFPKNQNNNFKVRLPNLTQSPVGENWKASLWGLSVADEGHSHQIISSNVETELVGHQYTFTQRYQEVDNS